MLRLVLLPAALLSAALLAGCSALPGAAASPTPTDATVRGSITLGASATSGDSNYQNESTGAFQRGTDCTGQSGYDDIADGAEVDVVDGAGKVLAVGHLNDGTIADDGYSCAFAFTVPDVPKVTGVYGVKVGNANRGIVHFSEAQLLAGPALTLGS